jgi:gamma-glutamylcyclotransferase (GGCT)/AIG2-like uncharacterized protein YtfP
MDVFVYGTLTDATQAAAVLDDFRYVGAATLSGLHRVEGRYPTLAPGGSVAGRLLRTDEMGALDRYEGVDRGLYVRVSVPITGADSDAADLPDEAAVYVGDPDALDAAADWPGDGDFGARVRRYLREQAVRLTPD